MAHYRIPDLKHPEGHQLPSKAKIVIVGAGMAGLFSAWRLIEEAGYDRKDIVILEKLNRTGGRLDSDLVKFDNVQVKEEEGGMRFTFDDMDNLMALFMTLTVSEGGQYDPDGDLVASEIVPFPMSSNGNNRLYFRGFPFSQKEAPATWQELYNLSYPEVHQTPSEMVNMVYNRILAANPEFTKAFPTVEDRKGPLYWQAFRLQCKWQDTLMKDWSLWNLFANMGYTNEAIQMIYQSSGFNGTFLSRMNGGVAYQLLKEFPADPEFKTLSEGFSTLPNALAAQIGSESIFLNTTVDQLDRDEDGFQVNYVITDEAGSPVLPGVIKAEKVILALPRQALETLFVRSNAFNLLQDEASKKLWNTLQTATNQPLVKINLYYDKAWWGSEFLVEDDAVAFGPNFADLPVGSIYPFYAVDSALAAALEYEDYMRSKGREIPEAIQKKLDKINAGKYARPAALTIYCDYMNVNYWLALQNNGALFSSPKQEQENDRQPQVMFAASQRVVEIATDYLRKVFNTTYVPEPVLTSARIWAGNTRVGLENSERFGYGVHQWALHAEDDKSQKALIEPIANLYTCNEAYSDYQGWVEGSLRSANLMLEKFGLKPFNKVFEENAGKSSEKAVREYYRKNIAEQIREYIDPNFEDFPEIVSDLQLREKYIRNLRKARHANHELLLTNFDLN